MIIGISGKISSGKDLCGKIIQYLTTESKIENSNIYPATFEQFCNEEYSKLFGYCDWKIVKFAKKLKQCVSIITGIPVEDLEKEEVKNNDLGDNWAYAIVNSQNTFAQTTRYSSQKEASEIARKLRYDIAGSDFMSETKRLTVRQLLQELGTEVGRQIHPNTWINALFADYKLQHHSVNYRIEVGTNARIPISTNQIYPNWIVTDLRFPNEKKAIEDRGGITIRVNRFDDSDMQANYRNNHPSETALDDATFDHVIENNGTIDDLIKIVKEILIKEKII